MRTFAYIFAFLIVFCQSGFGQKDRDRVELLRIAFITKKLQLTTAESEKFWPVYNEYSDKIKAVRKNLRQSYRRRAENMTEKDAEELYMLELQSRQAEADLHKQYSEKLKGIIGVKKLALLRLAEDEFRSEVLKTIKESGGD